MGDWVDFGNKRAYVSYITERASRLDSRIVSKYDFSFESVDDLRIFLNTDPKDMVVFGDERMRLSEFSERYFADVRRIYTSRDARLLEQVSDVFQEATESKRPAMIRAKNKRRR